MSQIVNSPTGTNKHAQQLKGASMPSTLTDPNVLFHFGDDHFLLAENSIIFFEGAGNPPKVPPFELKPPLDLGPSGSWNDVLGLNSVDNLTNRHYLLSMIQHHTNQEAFNLTEELIGLRATLQHLALVQLNLEAVKSVHPATAAAFLHLEVDQHGYGAMLNLSDLPAKLSPTALHNRVITLVEAERDRRQ